MIVKGNKVICKSGECLTPGYVVIQGTTIKSVGATMPKVNGEFEWQEAEIVCAGFVDIHTHGLGGSMEV